MFLFKGILLYEIMSNFIEIYLWISIGKKIYLLQILSGIIEMT